MKINYRKTKIWQNIGDNKIIFNDIVYKNVIIYSEYYIGLGKNKPYFALTLYCKKFKSNGNIKIFTGFCLAKLLWLARGFIQKYYKLSDKNKEDCGNYPFNTFKIQ